MDSEKIKLLREKLSIPLDTAVKLLKKYNGDLLISEQEFHNDNIKEIIIATECNEEIAKTNYNHCNYDKLKAIEKINSIQIILSTRENAKHRNEIGFILCPKNESGENYKTVKRNDAFIPTDDFDYIIKEFKSAFPLQNPWSNIIEESFDACGHNYFDKKTCILIVDRINKLKTDNLTIRIFLQEVSQWIIEKLQYAEYIVVYGNL
jgi:hypothetical protein